MYADGKNKQNCFNSISIDFELKQPYLLLMYADGKYKQYCFNSMSMILNTNNAVWISCKVSG